NAYSTGEAEEDQVNSGPKRAATRRRRGPGHSAGTGLSLMLRPAITKPDRESGENLPEGSDTRSAHRGRPDPCHSMRKASGLGRSGGSTSSSGDGRSGSLMTTSESSFWPGEKPSAISMV